MWYNDSKIRTRRDTIMKCPKCGGSDVIGHGNGRLKCKSTNKTFPYGDVEPMEDCPNCHSSEYVTKRGFLDGRQRYNCNSGRDGCKHFMEKSDYIRKAKLKDKKEKDRVISRWLNTEDDTSLLKDEELSEYMLRKLLKEIYPEEYEQANGYRKILKMNIREQNKQNKNQEGF